MTARLDSLLNRTAFPAVRNLAAERRKLDLIRIAVGVVALVRTGLILDASRFYFQAPDCATGLCSPESVYALAELLLLLAFTLGLLTPVVTLLLATTYVQLDSELLTSTLGTDVLMILLILFLVSGAGATLSLDAWIMRRRPGGLLARGLGRLYGVLGLPSAPQLRIYLFLAFVAYGVISFSAVLYHQDDSFWRHGDTVGVMLTNSYLSRLHGVFRDLEAAAPGLFSALSAFVVALQGLFQVGMIGLIRWTWGYRFVVAYGLLFILVSIVALQLSYLPYLELGLWILLFSRARAEPVVSILYDDRCGTCRRTVRALQATDAFNTYALVPLSTADSLLERHGITREAAERDLYGIAGNQVAAGYALYRLAARKNPVLWPLVPILTLGGLVRIGPAIYGAVAKRRKHACDIGEILVPPGITELARPQATKVTSWLAVAALFAFGLFIVTRPQVQSLVDRLTGVNPARIVGSSWLNDPLKRIGLEQPNVFNDVDLTMENHWAVIWERQPDGSRRLVPFNAEDGGRLGYHRSDVVYFGNSLPWRRGMIGQDLIRMHRPGQQGYELIEKVLLYDYRRQASSGRRTYEIELFEAPSTDISLSEEERNTARKVYEYSEVIDE